jgi:uncharacterized phiE125 gp8 family phage protein
MTVYPISLSEVKQWLKIDHNEDDDKLNELIASAVNTVETYINNPIIIRSLLYVTDNYQIDDNCDMVLYLPNIPTSISFVKVYDLSDNEIVVTNYDLFLRKIVLNEFYTSVRKNSGFQVQYNAGIAIDALTTPADIKIVLKEIVSYFYDDCCDKNLSSILMTLSGYINLSLMAFK